MSFIDTQLFDTALSLRDQLDEQLAQSSLTGQTAQAGGMNADGGPQELAEETFTDLSQASQAQISREQFFDEDPPDIIDDQEMMSTLTNSISASVVGSEAAGLRKFSPATALGLLEP